MNQWMPKRSVAITIAILSLGSLAIYAADLATGKWDCTGQGVSDQDVEFVLDLKQSGQEVTGTITYGSDVVDIEKGFIHGNKLEIVIVTDDNRYVSSGAVEDNKITGTWSDEKGRTGTWKGQKQARTGN
jgi:hypothetical protein